MKIKQFFNIKGLFLVFAFINFLSFLTFSFYFVLIIAKYSNLIKGKYTFGILVIFFEFLLTFLVHFTAKYYYSITKNKTKFWLVYGLFTLILFLLSFRLFSKTPLDQL